MTPPSMTREAIKRFAVESTRESAQIEGRVVPATYARSERVKRFLAQRSTSS